jgi:hypothetical protein
LSHFGHAPLPWYQPFLAAPDPAELVGCFTC